jgi:thiamine pyrophosphokinase
VKEDALQRGTKIIEDPDQNSTDFTKCVQYLREKVFPRRRWPSNILCLGGLGGRVDQGLSQLHHLYMEQQDPRYNNGRVYLLSTEAITFVLKKGRHRIRVHDSNAPILGKHIGIIPLREPSIITTKGLEWDITDWPTVFGGQMSTSNHVREDVVEITTTGDVLFTIELNFPAGNHEHPELRRELAPIISMGDDMFFSIEANRYSC